ncbi:zinc finger protein 16-like [Cheilinus undulatus]|uniref:zinc finger protein 16-like n=1 Tax=Cheilinus undulatus TaxID=241271 RepID=UPI001BD66C92|nr:zinc finger protein 16-like [Cheilinus undulatus]
MGEEPALSQSQETAQPAQRGRKRKTVAEKLANKRRKDRARSKTRINIGSAFQRWRRLRELRGFQSDSMLAVFLLERYRWAPSNLMTLKHTLLRPHPSPHGSAVASESRSKQNDCSPVAPEVIRELFEEKMAEYEKKLRRLKEENQRQHKLLEAVFNPEIQLETADIQQLMVRKGKVLPEQQERSSSRKQEDPPELAHIKEEQEELWINQEGEQLQGAEEADINMFTFTPIPVKSEEEDGEKPQTSQLQENQSGENRDTEYLKTEAEEDCGGSEGDGYFNLDSNLQPATPKETSDPSGSETDDSADWKESDEPQESVNPLQNEGITVNDMIFNTGDTLVGSSECAPTFGQKIHIGIQTDKPLYKRYPRNLSNKPFSCSVCKKKFNWRTEMMKHMRVHSGEKPFSCSVCGKIFSLQGNLQKHAVVHTGEKPFSCSVCGKGFTSHGNLKTHLAIHTGEKPYVCSVCGLAFTRKGTLQRHSVVHTGEKPFSCSVCDRRFSQPLSLKKHRCFLVRGEKNK